MILFNHDDIKIFMFIHVLLWSGKNVLKETTAERVIKIFVKHLDANDKD